MSKQLETKILEVDIRFQKKYGLNWYNMKFAIGIID